MGSLPDRVRLAQPRAELVIELPESDHPEAMDEETLRVRTRPQDTRVDDTPLEVEISRQRRVFGVTPAKPRRLPLSVIADFATE